MKTPSKNLTDYTPLINKVANTFPEKYREDLVQEGYLSVNKALQGFDPSKGYPFTTYAYKAIQNDMIIFLRGEFEMYSLDEIIGHDDDGEPTTYSDMLEEPTNIVQDYENKDFYEQNLNNSPPITRFIKKKYYEEGMSPQQIIDLYGALHEIKSVLTLKKHLK